MIHTMFIRDICHFVDTSTIFSRHQKHTDSRSFDNKKQKIQIFTPIHNILTPGWNFLHLHRMWCMWQISGMVPNPPPTNPFCWSNRLKLLLQLIWDVSLHNWRVHPLYSCTRLCFRLTFKQLSTYLMHRTLYEQVLEILLPWCSG